MGCSSSSNSKELIDDKKLVSVKRGDSAAPIKQPRAVSAKEYFQSIQDSLKKLNEQIENGDDDEKYLEMIETLKEEKTKLARLKQQRKIEDSVYRETSKEIQTLENYFLIVDVKKKIENFTSTVNTDDFNDYENFDENLSAFRETINKIPRFRNGTKGRTLWEECYHILDDIEKNMKIKRDKSEYFDEMDSMTTEIKQLRLDESSFLNTRTVVGKYKTKINSFKNLDEEVMQRKEVVLKELDEIEDRAAHQECDFSFNEAKSSLAKIDLEIVQFGGTAESKEYGDIIKKLTILKKNCEKIANHSEEISLKKERLLAEIDGAGEKLKILCADNKRKSVIGNNYEQTPDEVNENAENNKENISESINPITASGVQENEVKNNAEPVEISSDDIVVKSLDNGEHEQSIEGYSKTSHLSDSLEESAELHLSEPADRNNEEDECRTCELLQEKEATCTIESNEVNDFQTETELPDVQKEDESQKIKEDDLKPSKNVEISDDDQSKPVDCKT